MFVKSMLIQYSVYLKQTSKSAKMNLKNEKTHHSTFEKQLQKQKESVFKSQIKNNK